MICGIIKERFILNRELVTAVANRVGDADSVILWDILKKTRTEDWWNLHEDSLYQLYLNMLEDMEREEQ